jgi:hypothetical protein
MKLGRKAVKTDSRTLRVADYATKALPSPPKTADWTRGVKDWGQFLNDQLGDCTVAAAIHALQVFSLNASTELTFTDVDALKYYEAWCGYDPSNPLSDQGGIELDVLNSWKNQELAGHALKAFAAVNPKDPVEVRTAISLFGGIYIGLSLPSSAQNEVGGTWTSEAWYDPFDSKYRAGSWGGHAVFVPYYDADGPVCVTWGGLQRMTWAFWAAYVDEAYALLSPDFLRANGTDPAGFDMAALEADLAAIR